MKSQKGHAMIELAVSAGVMVTFLAGTFQFGYTFYVYNQLVSAVGDGGRFASVKPVTSEPEADKAAIRAIDQRFTQGIMAKDWPAVAAMYTTGASFMPPNQPVVSGRAAPLGAMTER